MYLLPVAVETAVRRDTATQENMEDIPDTQRTHEYTHTHTHTHTHTRGGKKIDFSRFSLERFCLDSEKFIIDFLIIKKKKKYYFFIFFTHSFCVETQAASIIALFIESHN